MATKSKGSSDKNADKTPAQAQAPKPETPEIVTPQRRSSSLPRKVARRTIIQFRISDEEFHLVARAMEQLPYRTTSEMARAAVMKMIRELFAANAARGQPSAVAR